MVFNPNGSQFTFLILDCLKDGSRYGLEIIDTIAKRTNNTVVMKKPTLYSCLTRMEKKGLVSSSYWSDSELGGKRHYYTISDIGRKTLLDLNKTYNYENLNIVEEEEIIPSKPVIAQQDNLFSLLGEPVYKDQKQEEIQDNSKNVLDNQMDLFSFKETQEEIKDDGHILSDEEKVILNENNEFVKPVKLEEIEEPTREDDGILLVREESSVKVENIEESEKEDDGVLLVREDSSIKNEVVEENEELVSQPVKEETYNDAVLLSSADSESYNKKIYDTSSDLKKYRKKKSFSENQIEMNVVYEDEEQNELHKKQIEEFKKSVFENRNGNVTIEQPRYDYFTRFEKKYAEQAKTQESEKKVEETKEDDGMLITSRLDPNDVPRQRRIRNIDDEIVKDMGPLPAPRRDTEMEPTYKDMITKLYSKNNEKTEQPKEEYREEPVTSIFADYDSLKNYYKSHGVNFKIYNRQHVDYTHNTNKLKTIINTIMTGIVGLGSLILYLIISLTGFAKVTTNFFYYVPVIIMACIVAYSFYRANKSDGDKPCQRYNAQIMWLIFALTVLMIFCINICCGMFGHNMMTYATTLFVPIFLSLTLCPVRYYIADYVYKKYGK